MGLGFCAGIRIRSTWLHITRLEIWFLGIGSANFSALLPMKSLELLTDFHNLADQNLKIPGVTNIMNASIVYNGIHAVGSLVAVFYFIGTRFCETEVLDLQCARK